MTDFIIILNLIGFIFIHLLHGEKEFYGINWHDNDKIELKKKNSLINLPYLQFFKDDEEYVISHSNTCLTFLGKEFGMFGQTSKEQIECEQLLQESVDLRNIVTKFAYTHFQSEEDESQAAKEVFTSVFENSNSGKLQKFEHWLNAKDDNLVKTFLVGNNISAPDFNLFDTLDLYKKFLFHYNFVKDAKDENIFEAKDLAKYNVSAKVLEHSRDAKVTIIKKKRRKGYQRKRGHRQDLTLLQIQSISAAKTKKTAAKKPAAKKTESKK